MLKNKLEFKLNVSAKRPVNKGTIAPPEIAVAITPDCLIFKVSLFWKPKLNNSGNKMALHKPVAVNASNPHIEYENTENPTNIILILHIIKTSFFSLLGEIKKPPINLPTIIKSQ